MGDWWFRATHWFKSILWRSWLRPHLRPRTWERELRDFHATMRVPPLINGFLIEDHGPVVVHLIERDGPWDLCCLQGDTIEDAKREAMETLQYWADEAGTWSRSGSYSVLWHEREPTSEDKTYSR